MRESPVDFIRTSAMLQRATRGIDLPLSRQQDWTWSANSLILSYGHEPKCDRGFSSTALNVQYRVSTRCELGKGHDNLLSESAICSALRGHGSARPNDDLA